MNKINTLERARTAAQGAANLEGRPMAVLNLNTAGRALYVVREVPPYPAPREIVEIFQPRETEHASH